MEVTALIGWSFAIPVVLFFAAATAIGLWLRFLHWRYHCFVRVLEAATEGLVEALEDDDRLRCQIELTSRALELSERARTRYAEACRRFGVEPWT